MLASIPSALLVTSLLAIQPAFVSSIVVQDMASRELPPGLSIPDDIKIWGDYNYEGCFTDTAAARSLTVIRRNTGTIEGCLEICNTQFRLYDLTYVGLEYGSECYCDWVLQDTAVQVDDGECNVPCVGNASQPCGGANRLTIVGLSRGSPTRAQEVVRGGPNDWLYQGCYHDSQTAKVFPYRAIVDLRFRTFSLEACADACGQAGYSYAAVEYRNECWCGTSAQIANAVKGSDTECGMACLYSPYQRCGGPDRMSVYKLASSP